jgi:hypothetical protein
MTWPFPEPKNTPSVEVGDGKGETKPPEKTPAELIAESLTTALAPVLAKLGEQDARFAKLEDQTKPREPKPVVQPNETISVLDNEDAAFAQRMTPLLARQLELEGRVVYGEIKSEYIAAGYGDLWTQYENEICTVLDSSPLVGTDGKPQRGSPQYIRNVVDMVLGRAARKAGMRFDGKSKGFFLETGGSSTDAPPSDKADGMNDNQRKVIARMGIPLEKAKETMKKLVMVN